MKKDTHWEDEILELGPYINNIDFINDVSETLTNLGYRCSSPFVLDPRRDPKDRMNTVQLLADNGYEKLAIELNKDFPHKKSIYKLRNLRDATPVILLRSGSGPDEFNIGKIICLRVKTPQYIPISKKEIEVALSELRDIYKERKHFSNELLKVCKWLDSKTREVKL